MAVHGDFGEISISLYAFGVFSLGIVGGGLCWFFVFQTDSKNQSGRLFSFVRYFECLENFYFWELFCHQAAGRYTYNRKEIKNRLDIHRFSFLVKACLKLRISNENLTSKPSVCQLNFRNFAKKVSYVAKFNNYELMKF